MRRMEMSSIGFAALGRSILKNNRLQRSKPKRYISLVGKISSYQDPKQASHKLLEKIKTKLIKEQKERQKKIIIIMGVVCIIVMLSIYLININL